VLTVPLCQKILGTPETNMPFYGWPKFVSGLIRGYNGSAALLSLRAKNFETKTYFFP